MLDVNELSVCNSLATQPGQNSCKRATNGHNPQVASDYATHNIPEQQVYIARSPEPFLILEGWVRLLLDINNNQRHLVLVMHCCFRSTCTRKIIPDLDLYQ